tara:strand:+ start:3438 stop:3638 length:201 start_codon:yes stop_codon:yes gene_type:complete
MIPPVNVMLFAFALLALSGKVAQKGTVVIFAAPVASHFLASITGGGDHVATGLLCIDPLSMPGVAM